VQDPDGRCVGLVPEELATARRHAEADSETPYMTRRAIEFMEQAGDAALVPASQLYQAALALYRARTLCRHVWPRTCDPRRPARARIDRGASGLQGLHGTPDRQGNFSRDEVRDAVLPAYMGLIKQCDDQMGVLFAWLKETGRWDDTLIVLTSDHGDYLGDHWMGEKDLFHDPSVKVPLIIYDPIARADATRGTTCDALVEASIWRRLSSMCGRRGPPAYPGRPLALPWLRPAQTPDWREFVVSEYDYSVNPAVSKLAQRSVLGAVVHDRGQRWKFMHAEGMRPQLFDMDDRPIGICRSGRKPRSRAISR
jgi:arylsulfatase A-like enzyme